MKRLITFSRLLAPLCMMLFVLTIFSAFTTDGKLGEPAPSAPQPHALTQVQPHSGGGCWSYHTWSTGNVEISTTPPMYGYDGSSAPFLGLGLDSCTDQIYIAWTGNYDYYKIDWKRPGIDSWQQFQVAGNHWHFNNAHFNTTYNFAIKGCTSHPWPIPDSCTDWSPTVSIDTTIS